MITKYKPIYKLLNKIDLTKLTESNYKNNNIEAITKFKYKICDTTMSYLKKGVLKEEDFEGSVQFSDTEYMDMIKELKSDKGTGFYKELAYFLEDGHKFNIEDGLFKLLNLTKNEVYYRKQPFDSIFINKEIDILDRYSIYGILITDKGDENYIITMGRDNKINKSVLFNFRLKDGETFEIENEVQLTENIASIPNNEIVLFKKEVANLVCNFLDIFNNPNVEKEIKRLNNKEKDLKGRLRFNTEVYINSKDKLKEYIYDNLESSEINFKHSFWVAGHYVHFKDINKYKRIYGLSLDELNSEGLQKERYIKRWILPYIKGKGELVNKTRIIK